MSFHFIGLNFFAISSWSFNNKTQFLCVVIALDLMDWQRISNCQKYLYLGVTFDETERDRKTYCSGKEDHWLPEWDILEQWNRKTENLEYIYWIYIRWSRAPYSTEQKHGEKRMTQNRNGRSPWLKETLTSKIIETEWRLGVGQRQKMF